MRRMSSNTDVMAASPFARSSLHSSTAQRVPMMDSSRVNPVGMRNGRHASRQQDRGGTRLRAAGRRCMLVFAWWRLCAMRSVSAIATTLRRGRHDEETSLHTVAPHSPPLRPQPALRQRARRSPAHRSLGRARRIVRVNATPHSRTTDGACLRHRRRPQRRESRRRRGRPARQRRDGGSRRERQVQRSHHGLAHRRQRRLADRRAVHRHRAGVHHGKGIEGIADGKLTLGADASVAAGPVGRAASAAHRPELHGRGVLVLAQSRTVRRRPLDGSILSIDSKSNKGLYGKTAPASDIIAGRVSTDVDAAKRFERAILASTAR